MTKDERFRSTILYYSKPFFRMLAVFCSWSLFMVLYFSIRRSFRAWDTVQVVLTVPVLVIFIVKLIEFCRPLLYMYDVLDHDEAITKCGYVFQYYGRAGAGKSRSGAYDGYYLAQYMADEKRFEYLLVRGRQKDESVDTFASMDEMWRYYSLKQAVEYFDNNNPLLEWRGVKLRPDSIPYFAANYAIWEKATGRQCAKLKMSHFLQRDRMPEGMVWLKDEAADDLSNKRSDKTAGKERAARNGEENPLLDETLSKNRHWGEWHFLLLEQSRKEVYLGARRVVTVNRYLIRGEDVCRPAKLMRKLEKLKGKILAADDCTPEQAAKSAQLKSRIARIGFTKIYYHDHGNEEDDDKIQAEGFYVLPCSVPYEYESRYYQLDYPALGQNINLELFCSHYSDDKAAPEAREQSPEMRELEEATALYFDTQAKRNKKQIKKFLI